MHLTTWIATLSVVTILGANPARAAVIYSSATLPITAGITGVGPCSPCGVAPATVHRTYAGFGIAGNATVESVTVQIGSDGDRSFDQINVSIWDDQRTVELFSQTFDRSNFSIDEEIQFASYRNYVISFDIADVLLTSGTYYLSVFGLNQSYFGWTSVRPTAAPSSPRKLTTASRLKPFGTNVSPSHCSVHSAPGEVAAPMPVRRPEWCLSLPRSHSPALHC